MHPTTQRNAVVLIEKGRSARQVGAFGRSKIASPKRSQLVVLGTEHGPGESAFGKCMR